MNKKKVDSILKGITPRTPKRAGAKKPTQA